MTCRLLEHSEARRKYVIHLSNDRFFGYIVLEKYSHVWNIELMHIIESYQNKSYGTQLLQYALEDMKLDKDSVTVCPTSDKSRRFFIKHGIIK